MPIRFTPNARARMHRCQVYASAFISSVVGLRLPYPLFVIVSVLSLSCLGWLLKSVLAEVEDGLLRYVKQRIQFYRRLGKSFTQITRYLAEEGHITAKTNRRVASPYTDVSS